MIQIIEAKENQYNIIRNIANKTWPHTFDGILPQKQIDYMLNLIYDQITFERQMRENQNIYLLSEFEENFNGFAAYQNNFDGTNKTKLHQLYVLPEFQGKGIGKLLFNEVMRRALEKDNFEIVLNVNRKNSAVTFYKHLGFKILEQEDIPIGNGFIMNDFIMSKTIKQSVAL